MGARPYITLGWGEGGGRSVIGVGWGDVKKPRRCNSKELKANTALESGNGGEQESLEERGEWEKEWDGGKKGEHGGCGMGYTHTHTRACQCPSEPVGVKHWRGAPPINHCNKRVCMCCSLLTAARAAGMGEDCNN